MPKLSLVAVDAQIKKRISDLEALRSGVPCFPLFLLADAVIDPALVDQVYDDLRANKKYKTTSRLDVLLYSSGGDLDAAYNIAELFRSYGTERLTYVVPRWAKSAATLLACSGDSIVMTRVAELGPMDPQITVQNALEGRLEEFSPLAIEATLALLREEYKKSPDLANGLVERLQFPLTLGSFKRTLDLSKQYLEKLLSTRMLKTEPDKVRNVASKLAEGYAHHGYCIHLGEAKEIGLSVEEVPANQEDVVWDIHRMIREKERIIGERKRAEMKKRIRDLPDLIRKRLAPEAQA